MPRNKILFAAVAALLAGCATTPLGPTAQVMPGPGKPFLAFAADQSQCKQYAEGEVGDGAMLGNLKRLGTAAISTALGGGMGAAVAGRYGGGVGTAAGALVGGGLTGRGSAYDQAGLQGRYNLAYSQCMYAHGNLVAGMTPPPAAQASPAQPGGRG